MSALCTVQRNALPARQCPPPPNINVLLVDVLCNVRCQLCLCTIVSKNECITPRTMLGWVPVEWSYRMYVLFTESYNVDFQYLKKYHCVSLEECLHTAWGQLCPSQNVLLEKFIPALFAHQIVYYTMSDGSPHNSLYGCIGYCVMSATSQYQWLTTCSWRIV